mmetsp:Transcript_12968/g.40744  ORF Transcript_12968/g.40744 Transcript_12968/m.40744 type:complete len:200 (+) Transcript_12968:178-777(+)
MRSSSGSSSRRSPPGRATRASRLHRGSPGCSSASSGTTAVGSQLASSVAARMVTSSERSVRPRSSSQICCASSWASSLPKAARPFVAPRARRTARTTASPPTCRQRPSEARSTTPRAWPAGPAASSRRSSARCSGSAEIAPGNAVFTSMSPSVRLGSSRPPTRPSTTAAPAASTRSRSPGSVPWWSRLSHVRAADSRST